jgi:hypothetical protein
MLVDWVISSNQPFTVVDDPSFVELLQYGHGNDHPLHVPSSTTVKRRVMDRSIEAVEAQRSIFKVSVVLYFENWDAT